MAELFETLGLRGFDAILRVQGETAKHTAVATGTETTVNVVPNPQQFVFDSRQEFQFFVRKDALTIDPGDLLEYDGFVYGIRSARETNGVYELGCTREDLRQ